MRKLNIDRALIMGKGVSGTGAKSALEMCGAKCEIADETDLDQKISKEYDLIVVSPSIPVNHRIFEFAKRTRTRIIGELELGFMLCDKTVAAVTGTNGKTTTVKLLGKMLGYEKNACVSGNVGRSFALDACLDYDVYAVESSSFQLEFIKYINPEVAVITNLTPDHLDRHGSFIEYARAKMNIANDCKNLVLSADDIPIVALKDMCPRGEVYYFSTRAAVSGAYLMGNDLYWFDERVSSCYDLKMQGNHNVSNALAAISAAKILGVKNSDIIRALGEFEPDAHRVEYVLSVRGIAFYDDSKGTNIAATIKAMHAMPSSFCLIAGGSDKGYEYDDLFLRAPKTLHSVCAVGETAAKILSAASRCGFSKIDEFSNMENAVNAAYVSGAENVLLSPASASFDRYSSYAERGKQFVAIAKEIKNSEAKR